MKKNNEYKDFEKGMIYMKILKKGGSREKGGGGSEIHVPVININTCNTSHDTNTDNPSPNIFSRTGTIRNNILAVQTQILLNKQK